VGRRKEEKDMKYSRMLVLLLAVMLMLSTLLIAVPIARGGEVSECDREDPVHIYYQGNKISNPPGPIVWTGPCTGRIVYIYRCGSVG